MCWDCSSDTSQLIENFNLEHTPHCFAVDCGEEQLETPTLLGCKSMRMFLEAHAHPLKQLVVSFGWFQIMTHSILEMKNKSNHQTSRWNHSKTDSNIPWFLEVSTVQLHCFSNVFVSLGTEGKIWLCPALLLGVFVPGWPRNETTNKWTIYIETAFAKSIPIPQLQLDNSWRHPMRYFLILCIGKFPILLRVFYFGTLWSCAQNIDPMTFTFDMKSLHTLSWIYLTTMVFPFKCLNSIQLPNVWFHFSQNFRWSWTLTAWLALRSFKRPLEGGIDSTGWGSIYVAQKNAFAP